MRLLSTLLAATRLKYLNLEFYFDFVNITIIQNYKWLTNSSVTQAYLFAWLYIVGKVSFEICTKLQVLCPISKTTPVLTYVLTVKK